VRSEARESLKRYRYAEAPEPQEEYQQNRRQEVPN
jgi:hypothetical protein